MVRDALIGLAVGDALGVPVEFKSRVYLKENPVSDMQGYGTHHQPPGTWSDDSSLAFCLSECLTRGFDLNSLADRFIGWFYENEWTPHGEVFDVGIATREAIRRLAEGCRPELAGGMDEIDNGNGSLMRILPLVFYIKDMPIDQRFMITKQVSSLTHAHIRSAIACFYYLEFARLLINGTDKFAAYQQLKKSVTNYLHTQDINTEEVQVFHRLLNSDIFTQAESEIRSSGYVLHTLEASFWCLLTTSSYAEAVLKAVNLGDDTDTTGAITGGLAGILYGEQSIPEQWRMALAREQDIADLADRLALAFACA